MFLTRLSFSTLIILLAVLLASVPGRAQSADANVAVVDIQKILASAAAANSVRAQVAALTKALGEDARKWQKDIRKEEGDLIAQKPILSAERFNQRREELAQKAKGHQSVFNNRRRQIDTAFGDAMAQIHTVFRQVTEEIAKEKKIQMVFKRSTVVLSPPQMDITDEVLARMDRKLPKVAVKLPK